MRSTIIQSMTWRDITGQWPPTFACFVPFYMHFLFILVLPLFITQTRTRTTATPEKERDGDEHRTIPLGLV